MRFAGIMLACVASMAVAQNSAVPVDKEPVHHLVLANELTRVYSVTVPVGGQTLLHQHNYDYVFVALDDAVFDNQPEGKPATRVELHAGDVRFAKAPLAHIARNVGNTPFCNITISVLKSGDAGETQQMLSQMGSASVSVVSNQKVSARSFVVGPNGSAGPIATFHPHLLIAVSDIHFRESDNDSTLKAGEVRWFDHAGTLYIEKSATAAKFALVEYK
ncbi:MAG TPA: hypothetical protein VFP40_19975 [Terriglobales bacterium]|nr:hypothetical protein [Terriglobales bacterium]